MSRQFQTKRGQATTKRIAGLLAEHGTVTLGSGSRGEPDIILKTRPGNLYAVECKRCSTRINSKKNVNNICILLYTWKHYLLWCETNRAIPIVIVELFTPKRKKIYFAIDGGTVTEKYENCKGKRYFGFSIWQIIDLGKKLSYGYFV